MKRTITIKKFDTNIENQKVRFDVYFAMGGMNYFSGSSEERGYYIAVQPYKDTGDGTISMMAFSGVKKLFLAAKRFSDSKLSSLAESLKDEDFKSLLDNVLAKNRLEILA